MKIVDKELEKVSGGEQSVPVGEYTIEVGMTYHAKKITGGIESCAKVTSIVGNTVYFDQGSRAVAFTNKITYASSASLTVGSFENRYALWGPSGNEEWVY